MTKLETQNLVYKHKIIELKKKIYAIKNRIEELHGAETMSDYALRELNKVLEGKE